MNKQLSRKYILSTFILSFLCWGIVFPFSGMLGIIFPLFYVISIWLDKKRLCECENGQLLIFDSSITKLYKWYALWVLFSFIYGVFSARNYYEYKHLFQNLIAVSLPLFLILFSNINNFQLLLRKWFVYGFIAGIVVVYPLYGFAFDYFVPILLLLLFWPRLNKKYLILCLVFTILYIKVALETDAREPLIKALASIGFGAVIYFYKRVKPIHIKLLKYLCYSFTLFFFLFALPNFVKTMQGQTGEAGEVSIGGGVDTRSLLYYDVINSALKNNYVIQGRSLSRGNDIEYSNIMFMIADDDGFFDDTELVGNERTANEICFANIFTWMGLVGLILYWCFYFKAVNLATNHSRNVIIPIIGCYIAFRWSMGWIADMNGFNVSNMILWGLMAMCYSPYMRNMSNKEINNWIKGFLPKF